jgi:large subunit ribosomal protein L3
MTQKRRRGDVVADDRLGILLVKAGSTTIFRGQEALHVTVLHMQDGANRVVAIRPDEKKGLLAVEITAGRAKHANKPIKGHCKLAGVVPGRKFKGFFTKPTEGSELKAGDVLDLSFFDDVSVVDVQATSKGKGFAGVIKRHGFSSCGMTHGVSKAHRKPGSTGQCQDPGRVFPGKKMPGQMGNKTVTILGLKLLKADKEKQVLLVIGAVPGPVGGFVVVKPSNRKAKAS